VHFLDRADAGRQLAEKLENYKGEDIIIYALPRGGVVLGYEVAKALGAPLGLVITRKIGHPHNPEYAVCAVTEDGALICSEDEKKNLDPAWLNSKVEEEKREAKRRRDVYLKNRAPLDPKGKTAVIVDDGVATGLTLRAAIRDIKQKNPKEIIVAVPVAPGDVADELKKEVDEFVALDIPNFYLGAVGAYYENFTQVEDEEVIDLLEKLRKND